jgi:hypothetical protein
MKRVLQMAPAACGNNTGRFLFLFFFCILSINLSGQKVYTMLGETWTSGNWEKSSLLTNTYDGSSYLTKSLSQIWDVPSLSWENGSQTNYTNNPDGTANQSTYQMWDGVSAWNDFMRSTYTYNSSKKVLTTVGEVWFLSNWMNSSKTINTYDGSGYLTNTLNQSWDMISSTYKNSSQTDYTNNPDGTVGLWITKTWDGVSAWINSVRLTNTYLSGKVQTSVYDQYTAGNWVPKTKLSYTYDGSGFLINILSQLWDAGSSTWKNNTRDNITNNPNGTPYQDISQKWDGVSVWNNTDRLTYGYSQPTGISDLIREGDFTIYPNPAQNVITIKVNTSISGSTYSISDQTGKMILKGKLLGETTSIDITQLTNGVYFVIIGERNQNTFKVIKQ